MSAVNQILLNEWIFVVGLQEFKMASKMAAEKLTKLTFTQVTNPVSGKIQHIIIAIRFHDIKHIRAYNYTVNRCYDSTSDCYVD